MGCITVPSREDHREHGIARPDFSCEPDPINRSWHHDVAEYKINLCPVREQAQCLFRRVPINGRVTKLLEQG